MPVKITQTTNPSDAQVSLTDLTKMKDSFINEVYLDPDNGRERIIKKFSVSIMKDEFNDLIEHYKNNGNIDVITINFAVNVNPFIGCVNSDLSDTLTVVVEAAKFIDSEKPDLGVISYDKENDFVLIPAFRGRTITGDGRRDNCCPSARP